MTDNTTWQPAKQTPRGCPWTIWEDRGQVVTREGQAVFDIDLKDPNALPLARRIVLCVNLLEPFENLESVKTLLEAGVRLF